MFEDMLDFDAEAYHILKDAIVKEIEQIKAYFAEEV